MPNYSYFIWRAHASTPLFAAHPWQPHTARMHPGRSKIWSPGGCKEEGVAVAAEKCSREQGAASQAMAV